MKIFWNREFILRNENEFIELIYIPDKMSLQFSYINKSHLEHYILVFITGRIFWSVSNV